MYVTCLYIQAYMLLSARGYVQGVGTLLSRGAAAATQPCSVAGTTCRVVLGVTCMLLLAVGLLLVWRSGAATSGVVLQVCTDAVPAVLL